MEPTTEALRARHHSVGSSCSSSGSGSSSTCEEERLRKLFTNCDADGDGYLDGDDFVYMCEQLNLEDSTDEILQQLGITKSSRISFEDFIRCRSQVLLDTETQCTQLEDERTETGHTNLEDHDTGIDMDLSRQHNNITSWPTMSSDSLGATSGRPDSLGYDSGGRDLMSPEPNMTLQKMLESHDPAMLKLIKDSCTESQGFLDLANRLHQAALTSLKGEIIELRSRLQRENLERDSLEKQLNKLHIESTGQQEEYEERLDELTFRYEERITELHSVIAELRKKIERHQINVIREEDESDLDPAVSIKSQDGGSLADNTVGSDVIQKDLGTDLNSELSRVVTELESAIHERKQQTGDEVDGVATEMVAGDDDGVEEKALEVCKKLEDFNFDPTPPTPPPKGLRPATFHPPPPPPPNEYPDPGYLQEEISSLRTENTTLQEQILKQEIELQRHRLALTNLTEETNRYKKQMADHQTRLQGASSPHHQGRLNSCEGQGSPHNSRTSTPTKIQQTAAVERATPTTAADSFPVAKVAELKKLKTVSSERHVLGSELTSLAMPNTKVAEHLVQSLWKGSNMQEIVQNLDRSDSNIDSKVTEFEIELERLHSQIDNLKSQLDVCSLTLEESKSQCDRLTVLIGKYESNNTALQIVLNYSDQCIEAYDILCALLESEQGVVLANCRAAGLGTLAGIDRFDDQDEITSILQRAHHSRKAAETVAKHLIHKLDRSYSSVGQDSAPRPWEDLSSTGKTPSTSSASSADAEFTKVDERRLRDYIHQLKSERNTINLTVMQLESVSSDPKVDHVCKTPEAQRLDLENAVIMQELMAIKEEKAEIKAQNYLLEKEKKALELRLSGKESREQAYLVQIEHLKSEVLEQSTRGSRDSSPFPARDESERSSPSLSYADFRSHDPGEMTLELAEALKREKKLKHQVSELVSALEKLSRNSEIRHQQSAEFVNDLKKANSTLISAFDKAKKKYQSKLKKLESQMQSLTERYETQIRMLKQRISRLEEEKTRVTNETSL